MDRARADVASARAICGGYSPVPEWAAKAHREAGEALSALRSNGEPA